MSVHPLCLRRSRPIFHPVRVTTIDMHMQEDPATSHPVNTSIAQPSAAGKEGRAERRQRMGRMEADELISTVSAEGRTLNAIGKTKV